jgi:hypothetical protein
VIAAPAVGPAERVAHPPVDGLSVCIPVLNEEGAIAETLRRCLAAVAGIRATGVPDVEVIVVDDGSTDGTAAIVRSFPDVRLIQHPVNRGYGAALKTGFAAARYELIGFLDADATYPPEQFPRLCEVTLREEADLVIGSRMAGEQTEMPAVRRLGNKFFAGLLTLVGRADVTDSASGMRVFRRGALDLLSPLPDGLNLTPVMSARAVHEGIKVLEVAIPYKERVGESKLSVTRDGMRFLSTILWTVMAYNPVRIFGLTGLAGVGLAVLVGVSLAVARLQGVTALGPLGTYAVFAALVCGVAGVSIFATGASFNYLVSLFYRRPIRQGLLRTPLFTAPIEKYFLPSGIALLLVGVSASGVSLGLSYSGWPIERLWLYLSASALLALVGLQLTMSWLMMSVLRELSERERVR